mmetsp:Transcript_27150/g.67899  ORF Transcript_27150/g.67899 Transcript_27150/m.67899 type:complete len:85 (+) Transcript_27150:1721-1975(+)
MAPVASKVSEDWERRHTSPSFVLSGRKNIGWRVTMGGRGLAVEQIEANETNRHSTSSQVRVALETAAGFSNGTPPQRSHWIIKI